MGNRNDLQSIEACLKYRKPYGTGFKREERAVKKIEILVVEDEPKLAQTISDFLRIQNYEVETALTGNKALEYFCQNKQKVDLILLDLMLPDISGYTVLKEIRKISEVPVIILSARSAVADQMSGFEKGADDYITKPFTLALVKMHIEAVLKRAGKLRTMVEYNDLQADVNAQLLFYKGQHIPTTRKEFDLMVYFMEHSGIVLPRDTILNAVWEYDYTGDVRTIDTLVKQLRKKWEKAAIISGLFTAWATSSGRTSMKIKKNFWRAGKALWIQIIAFAVAVMLYSVCCYPIYTSSKARIMRQLYEDIHDMDLEELSEDDEETLGDYQKEKFETVIANENYEQIYTSRSSLKTTHARKYIENKIAQYTEEGTLEQRRMESRHILMFRGKIIQDGHTFYVYLRKDVQSVLEVIEGTRLYLAVVLLLMVGLSYFLEKMSKASTEKKAKQSDYQLLESQREFVANISHELKTPLAVVSSQVEMLEIAGDKIDRSYYYSSIHEELDKMSRMVGELLDFSMLDNQMSSMEMSRVNVSEMIEYLLLRYDAMFRKNEIKVEQEIEKNCFAYGNRMYLERAVNNYLMNAFQHTEQGKRIRITLKKEKKQIRMEVYNDGAQIKEEQMEHIWDSFYTTSQKKKPVTSENEVRNIGLGLFVVRKIVDKHKGSCGAKNMENGVLFWLQLPEIRDLGK